MNEKEFIINRLQAIESRIANACRAYNRQRKDVKLLLATKTVLPERICHAINEGYTLLGENRVQEAEIKHKLLNTAACSWHMIGHLQTNKVKHVLKFADVIQSVDRLNLAQRIQNRCEFENRYMDVYIQVNTSGERSKFGVEPAHTKAFIDDVSRFDRLRIKGLMTIGLLSSSSDKVRDCFKRLKEIQVEVNECGNVYLKELSMGMSNDLELAIAEGSTMVRVGTSIFGQRVLSDSYFWNENTTLTP